MKDANALLAILTIDWEDILVVKLLEVRVTIVSDPGRRVNNCWHCSNENGKDEIEPD